MNVKKVNYKDANAPSEFTKSLKHTGFSVLTDHPIDKDLIDTVYKEWADFFNSESKNKYLLINLTKMGISLFRLRMPKVRR